jgi:uncharacterized protein (TIGR02646 family)
MRFVDIDLLQLPNGWQGRATQALNDLRTEIVEAEAAAVNSGQDVARARKVAIKAGLDQNARKRIWRDLDPHLAGLKNGQCWYSESRNPTSDKNVDHFRPKGRVEEDAMHEGYWWLAFTWRNYRYSSQWCNQRRVNDFNGTGGGKADHFPLFPNSFRAQREGDDIDLEDVQLLDPIDPEDWRLLTFRSDGHPTPSKQVGTREYQRAETSIEVYHLHCKQLVDDRRTLAGTIQRLVQELERLRSGITDRKIRAVYKRLEIDLLRAIRPDSEYSSAALAYARAEVYVIERGHQVKREWLEEILI